MEARIEQYTDENLGDEEPLVFENRKGSLLESIEIVYPNLRKTPILIRSRTVFINLRSHYLFLLKFSSILEYQINGILVQEIDSTKIFDRQHL